MIHESAPSEQKHDVATPYKTRLGLWMFLLYALVYVGFIAINLINPKLMETPVFSGINLAIVYGMGLIIFAFVLALIYNAMSSSKENEFSNDGEEK